MGEFRQRYRYSILILESIGDIYSDNTNVSALVSPAIVIFDINNNNNKSSFIATLTIARLLQKTSNKLNYNNAIQSFSWR